MTLPPKLKQVLAACGWAALVAVLQTIKPLVPPRAQGAVDLVTIAITGLAKYSPQSAVVMTPPNRREDDPLFR